MSRLDDITRKSERLQTPIRNLLATRSYTRAELYYHLKQRGYADVTQKQVRAALDCLAEKGEVRLTSNKAQPDTFHLIQA